MAHHMRNLPIMMLLVERSEHRNVQLCTRGLLCGGCLARLPSTCGSAQCSPTSGRRPTNAPICGWALM